MEILAAFLNGKSYLWYHPESDCHYIDYDEASTDGLGEIVAAIYLEGETMRVHFPELYEAHRARDREFLTRMAEYRGLTYEEFQSSNWDNEGILDMTDTVIHDGFEVPPVPVEAQKRRGRKPGSSNKPSASAALQAALQFVSPVENDINEYGEFVALADNMAIMNNGQWSAGHPIAEQLSLTVKLDRLKLALARTGKTLVITETEGGQLSIKGDKLRAVIPALTQGLPPVYPDPPVVEGDLSLLKQAFKVCGTLASEAGERVVEATLLLEPNVCTGTNGAAMLQFWHGLNVPPGTVLPKAFTQAVAKSDKPLTGIGASWSNELGFATSFTCWFEGGAWLKTQCYQDRWPNIDHLLNVASAPSEVPAGLFDAIEAVSHFVDEEKTRRIYFTDGFVRSHLEENVGGHYEVKGLPAGKTFDGSLIKLVAPWVQTIDLTTYPDRAFFFGKDSGANVRGVIMAMGAAS